MSFRIRSEVEPPRCEFGELEITNASGFCKDRRRRGARPWQVHDIANAAIENAAAALLPDVFKASLSARAMCTRGDSGTSTDRGDLHRSSQPLTPG